MYRILLADDEGIMLEALRTMIRRQLEDEVEIETAKTGRAAIETAELFHPDIIFMDIQMPGINGIQALREIRRFNAAALMYVISAYDKFDYAKEAIDLGVERYLMKPINRTKIAEVLQEACAKIDGMRSKRRYDLSVQEKLETIIPVVENGFVSNMLLSGETAQLQYFRNLLDMSEEYGYVVVYTFGTGIEDGKLISPVGISVKAQGFYPEFRAIVKSFTPCIIGGVMTDRIVTVVPSLHAELPYEGRVQVIDQVRRTISRLEEKLGVFFRAGIGRVRTLGDLRSSYQEATIALQESDSRVVHTGDVLTRGNYEDDFPIELEKELFQAFRHGELQSMTDKANRFFDWMIHRHPEDRDNIRLKVLEYVLWAEKEAFHEGVLNYRFEKRKFYLSDVMSMQDYVQLRKWFMDKMTDLCRSIMRRRQEQSESVVNRAKNYIQENYAKDISLDEVSREVNVSPYYFSKLFKSEAGVNFIDYLTGIRIDRARALLEDPGIPIKEIGIEVGYVDPNYFSRIFKKQTQMSPREYREHCLSHRGV